MPEKIYVKTHYCIICKKSEVCLEEECDFREILHAHGYCYAKLSKAQQGQLDQDIENGLSADVKEAERKAKRDLYMKEYRKQWKENNPKYHNDYRERNPETIRKITKKYYTSEKGKAVRKRYADKTKKKRSEYQKNYMKEYRKRKREEKIKKEDILGIGTINKKTANPLVSPLKQSPPFRPQINPSFGQGLGMGVSKPVRSKQLGNLASVNEKQRERQRKAEALRDPNLGASPMGLTTEEKKAVKMANNVKLANKVKEFQKKTETKIKLLENKIKEMEHILELGTEGTRGVTNIQKLLMQHKIELKKLQRSLKK